MCLISCDYENMAICHHCCAWGNINKSLGESRCFEMRWIYHDNARRQIIRSCEEGKEWTMGAGARGERWWDHNCNWFFQKVRKGWGYVEGHYTPFPTHIHTASPATDPSQKPPAVSNPTQSPSQLRLSSISAKINEIFSHQNEKEQRMRSTPQGLPN